ncbi:MAG: hypothetical protein E7017_05360 [Alphaproteobacteria bacterium]|nr:hypothetical protein [Alphaproteobacteria bacterium]
MVTIAITVSETLEHYGHDIGIGVSMGDEWQEYHGNGINIPRTNEDKPMSRTWICNIEKDKLKPTISFCFYNLHRKISEIFEYQLVLNKTSLHLRRYNENKLDKLDKEEKIDVDYWITTSIFP